MKVSYNFFILIITLICYGILFYIWYKFQVSLHVFFALYFPILIFYDINQVRNFIMATLLTLAIVQLLREKKMSFFLIIVVASTIQSLALVYLVLLLFSRKTWKRKVEAVTILFLAIGLSIVVFLNNKEIPFLYDIFTLIFGEQSDKLMYFKNNNMGWGFLLMYLMQMVSVFALLISIKNLKRNHSSPQIINFSEGILTFNSIGFLAFPILMINLTFYRIFRNFSFVNYIVIAFTISSFQNKNKNLKYLFYIAIIFLYSLIWKYGIIIKYGGESQVDIILKNNIIQDIIQKWIGNLI